MKSRKSKKIDSNRKVIPEYDPPKNAALILILLVMILILWGLIILYSTCIGSDTGTSLVIKQSIWIIIGIITASVINIVGYEKILKLSNVIVVITITLLIAVLFSRPINGAYRWIKLPGGFGNIQPSELAKIAIIMFLADYIPKYQRKIIYSFKGLFIPLLVTGIVIFLVLLGKDLGTTALLSALVWFMLFISGVRLRYLIIPIMGMPILPFLIKHYSKVRWARITSFLNPEKYQHTIGYQLWLSILALGSGSWAGVGFAQSRMKAQYLPEAHTDFILSILGEELGFVAILAITLLYLIVVCLGMYISIKAKDKRGVLLGFGITAAIAMQAIINLGVISGAFPTKGMPAPFISYGGSNIIVCITGIGFLISIANFKRKENSNGS